VRLYVTVREGDHVATSYSPAGTSVTGRMIALAEFDVHGLDDRSEDDATSRWARLDAALLARSCTVDIPPDTPVATLTELALAAARAAGLASRTDQYEELWSTTLWSTTGEDTRVWLTDPATDAPLSADDTAGEAGLTDGDLVVLCIEHPPQGLYRLLPAATPEQLFARLVLSERLARSRPEPTVHGVLLYTDADAAVATFVRTHFDELNALTGTMLRIFVMERPSDWRAAKRYWKPHLEPELYRSLAALRWLRWVPYERARAYDLARGLGVPVDALPCLVLSTGEEDDRKLVFPIDGLTIGGVRRLVREIADVVGVDGAGYDLDDDVESSRYLGERRAPRENPAPEHIARLRLAEQRLRDALRPVRADSRQFVFRDHAVFVHIGGTVSDQFNFHGQTTFVNRPVNTVITDFQNSHGDGPAQRRLGELLQVVLASTQLGDAERERLAKLVDEAAGEVARDSPEPGKVRGILETVKTAVSDASDIAGPAIGIISKVLELLP
jgi:hypothetical protein